MSYPLYPTLINKPDSRKYSVTSEDPAVRSTMEGGYVVSRPRYTRAARKIWNIGYTFVPDQDKDDIEAFCINTVKVGSSIFSWTNPEDGVTYYVRFKGAPTYKYVGAGNNRRWDIDFQLEQA